MNHAWKILLPVSMIICSLSGSLYAQMENSEKIAAGFVDLLAAEKFDEAVSTFDSTMTRVMPAADLKKVWEQVCDQAGSFQRYGKIMRLPAGKYTIYLVRSTFAKYDLDIKVVLDKQNRVSGLFFQPVMQPVQYKPPAYADTSSFREIGIQFGEKEWLLPGTLTIPRGEGPFPALVLVHGSGPNDRDETIGPNKPFRDLAWGLASRGIAVLRYDKRTRMYGAKILKLKINITVKEETVDDAVAAAGLLARRPEIDPERIYVLGHSLGGMLIPRIATRLPEGAGFIILAGPTRPLEDITLEQFRYIFALDGKISPEEADKLKEVERDVAAVKRITSEAALPSDSLIFAAPAGYWFDLRDYHPALAAREIAAPLLILQGGRDYQVTKEDFQGWKSSLNGCRNVTFKLYPDLNHLFMTGKGKSQPMEYQSPKHVDPDVIADIAAWVNKDGKL